MLVLKKKQLNKGTSDDDFFHCSICFFYLFFANSRCLFFSIEWLNINSVNDKMSLIYSEKKIFFCCNKRYQSFHLVLLEEVTYHKTKGFQFTVLKADNLCSGKKTIFVNTDIFKEERCNTYISFYAKCTFSKVP